MEEDKLNQRFGNRVAIVTGGARGIGRAISVRLLEEGCSVLVVDQQDELLKSLPNHARLEILTADVTSGTAPSQIVDACKTRFGKIDVLVNNAGVGNAPKMLETTDADFDRWIDINLRSVFRLSRSAASELIETQGNVVNIASVLGMSGFNSQAPYSAAKGGVIAMTRQMAAELAPLGVRVNAIAPGIVATEGTAQRLTTRAFTANIIGITPLGRAAAPREIATSVAFLASDDASFITGHVLVVDGGMTASCYLSDDIVQRWVAGN